MNINLETSKAFLESFLDFLVAEKGLTQNTVISYKFDVEQFLEFVTCIHKKTLKDVTYFDVLSFFEKSVMERELESSSQLRKISVLFNFYEFLKNNHGFFYNPLTELERPSKNEKLPIFLEEEEMKKLLSAAKRDRSRIGIRNYAVLTLLYSSGMRISECLCIKLPDILIKSKSGYKIKEEIIIMGKGGRERMIFINQISREAIIEYLEIRKFFSKTETEYLFNADGVDGRLSRQNFFYHLKKMAYFAKVDYEKLSPHKIRHSFATHMFLNGIDIRILQELLGHADISTTQIYTHINSQSLKNTVQEFHPFSNKK